MNYKFKNNFIKDNYKDKKEYYFLGFQCIDYYISKLVYNYLMRYDLIGEFCCDFDIVQKIIKKITSKEYFNKIFSENQKTIYSYLGAIIFDDESSVEREIDNLYKVESFLLNVFKKDGNIYMDIKKYLDKNNLMINTYYSFNQNVECSIEINNQLFKSIGNSLIESKYDALEKYYQFLISNKLFYDIKDLVAGYDPNNSYNKLEQLFNDGYINKPNYLYIEHDEFNDIKYEVRCSVNGYNFYSVKIHNNKEVAKNLAAYSMIEMIIMNC